MASRRFGISLRVRIAIQSEWWLVGFLISKLKSKTDRNPFPQVARIPAGTRKQK